MTTYPFVFVLGHDDITASGTGVFDRAITPSKDCAEEDVMHDCLAVIAR